MKMSQTVLHLLKHEIEGEKGLRYLNVRLSKDVDNITPLYFGTDILNNSSINSTNHCRIHTRYAKIGLATKILFPTDVTISGLTHCLNGAWFYSLQGVFQVIFEHQDRKLQLKIVTSLINMWQSIEADPKLPRRLSVTLENLQPSFVPNQEAPLSINRSFEGKTSAEKSIVVDSTSDYENRVVCLESAIRKNVGKNYSFQRFSNDLLHRVEQFAESCSSEEKYLTNALISFLKLVYRDSKSKIGEIFNCFLQTIIDFSYLLKSDSKIATSSTAELSVNENEDILLNLAGVWIGKTLNEFKDVIAKRVDLFKLENFNLVDDLPSAHVLVPRLFPNCMRLLVGYWIGLYGSPPSPPPPQDTSVVKKLYRQDHSYSTNAQSSKITGGKREDHSYSSSNPTIITTTTTWLETAPVSPQPVLTPPTPPTRDDHTYVHHECSEETATDQPKTRKDHTYVSTKEPRGAKSQAHNVTANNNSLVQTSNQISNQMQVPSLNSTKDDLTVPPPHKKIKLAATVSKFTSLINIPHVIDSSKHSFVLLILEFLNNVLVSGIGHVVYTRLIQTNKI